MAVDRVPEITGSPASIDEALEFVAEIAATGGGVSGPSFDLVETSPGSRLFKKVEV